MPGNVCQIVDAPISGATVLYDFNNENPCAVAAFSAPPPSLVRVSVQTQSQDGATDAGSVYGDRILDLDLDLFSTTQDAWASSFQTLARLLSNPAGQWFKYQPVGATSPVFFRLRRGDVSSIDDIISSTAARTLHLQIPALPFAVGVEVVGSTATITNDPTAGTNPMSLVLPSIQGDVLTPLRLKLQAASDLPSLVVASASHSPSLALPLYADYTAAYGSPSSGWTHSTDVAGTHIGGNAAKAVKVNPGSVSDIVCVATPSASANAGEYRLFVRASVPVGWTITNEGSSVPIYASSAVSTDATMMWRDMGVVSLPLQGQPDSPWPNTDAASFATSVYISARAPLTTSAGTVIVDAAVLVPAGLANSLNSNVALIAPTTVGASIVMSTGNVKLWLDGYQSEVVTKNGITRWGSVGVVATAFAKAVPGAANVLHCFSPTSAKTATITLDWSYYPRYLHVRPATT